ncbi:sn1-specific diacylglycerol lipase beta [Caerostris extrusa]|uniref:Sn1-specific diacylglycerol lipase beta n=1 Tax=Caerostris extrusa TaxID=172846 RepID=A0AAV4QH98_CAEEX|nr:sn1-specific diacylglycerol lipase beta [Caerostris extrusa]
MYDHETKAILVMDRGTMSMDDILTNVAATFATMDDPGCPPGTLCHQGVLNASREIKRASLITTVESTLACNGKSLGKKKKVLWDNL